MGAVVHRPLDEIETVSAAFAAPFVDCAPDRLLCVWISAMARYHFAPSNRATVNSGSTISRS